MKCQHCDDEVTWDADLETWEHHRRHLPRWRCAGTDRLAEPSRTNLNECTTT